MEVSDGVLTLMPNFFIYLQMVAEKTPNSSPTLTIGSFLSQYRRFKVFFREDGLLCDIWYIRCFEHDCFFTSSPLGQYFTLFKPLWREGTESIGTLLFCRRKHVFREKYLLEIGNRDRETDRRTDQVREILEVGYLMRSILWVSGWGSRAPSSILASP